MKTDRLTLLIAPAEKAAIAARADQLGLSVSELVRRAVDEYRPGEGATRAELEAILPQAESAIGQIGDRLDHAIARLEESEARWAHYDSEEYRSQVRDEVLADPTINWDAVRLLFGTRLREAAA